MSSQSSSAASQLSRPDYEYVDFVRIDVEPDSVELNNEKQMGMFERMRMTLFGGAAEAQEDTHPEVEVKDSDSIGAVSVKLELESNSSMLANLQHPEGAKFNTPSKKSDKPLSVLDELETYW